MGLAVDGAGRMAIGTGSHRHFERAITLNPSFALARNNLHALQRLIAQER